MQTQRDKNTKIGRKRYVDPDTGEERWFDVISQEASDFNFNKIWLALLMDSIDAVGNKKMQVLKWLMSNKDSKNQIIGTQDRIAKEIGISKPTVNETIRALKHVDAIRQVQSGVLQLNPEMIFKGHKERRMSVILEYKELPHETDDQIKEGNENG